MGGGPLAPASQFTAFYFLVQLLALIVIGYIVVIQTDLGSFYLLTLNAAVVEHNQ